ncbi:MAG: T9SS type A sorting domain-containing protein [Chitinophagaceae bacterium]|nr:T9SS type A sorting domain-containing protein [Chitinophagaceae bacterium]
MGIFYKALLCSMFLYVTESAYGQSTTLINANGNGGFEMGTDFAANGWVEANGTQINRWYVGTGATGYTGARCAWVSKNGTGYTYNIYLASVTHFYRDVTFPAGEDLATLTFSWKGEGESNVDFMKVYLVPVTTTPAAGVELLTGQIGSAHNLTPNWTTSTITICGVAGTTQRLVFSWINDLNAGTQPPAAIDNISLVSSVVGASCTAVLGTGVTSISALPYNSGAGTTQAAGNDVTGANAIVCGSTNYYTGQDKVWEFTPTVSGQVTIALASNGSYTGLMLYDGCPIANVCSGVAGTCVSYVQSATGNKSMCVDVVAGHTYYLLLDSYAAPAYNAYSNLYISEPVPVSGSNDQPCFATALTLGVNSAGDNSCATATGEPAMPSCWNNTTSNTVWYSVVCPASGALRIRTISGTLTDTQIGLYKGSCSSLTTIAAWCNNNAPSCGTSAYSNSELIINSGLIAGDTYFIVVDGTGSTTGSFDIQVSDASLPVVPAAGQECASTNPVCNQVIAVGNPGFAAYGNICDFGATGGNCLAAGERGSAWYEIVINAAGFLEFDIVPNDWSGTGTASTDYDFAIWKTAGSGSTTCAEIAAGTVNPLRCNYNNLGVTGVYGATASTAPPAYPGFDAAYEKRITVANGDKYQLVVSNYSNSTSGFSINIDPVAPVSYTTPTQVIWSGGSNTTWTVSGNWGGCATPTCSIDAVVSPAASNQPVLISGTYESRDITINQGATLTLAAGAVLNVCGNFYNYGSIIADPTSTIAFIGTGTQNIYGSLVGADKFGNVLISKSAGTVILNAGMEIAGDFTLQNNTGIFNVNGQYLKLAGNFLNAAGTTTFTGVSGSTIEFNGIADQLYSPGGSLTLNDVFINQGVPAAIVLTGNSMTISGSLTLTSGRIETLLNEVNVTNSTPAAVNAGNINSYVDGDLRRATTVTGSYDFPVGHFLSGKGYQLANIDFTAANTATELLARFRPFSLVPAALGLLDCGITYNLEALDNGSWTIASTPSVSTGVYTATLYNTPGTYSNSGGASSWTVMKYPTLGTGWLLDGTCVTSTISQVSRTGLTGFSEFATAQSVEFLPVTLIAFSARATDKGNQVEWTTASEFNNDYFSLEKSADGNLFEEINKQSGLEYTLEQHHYDFLDDSPFHGLNYYRLRQVNTDGTFAFSKVVIVENMLQAPLMSRPYPNPTTGKLNFEISTMENGTAFIQVMDVFGKLALSNNHPLKAGTNPVTLDLQQLPEGVYFIACSLAQYGFLKMEKVVIQ